jgi:membrane associated rhomboid family serine protease
MGTGIENGIGLLNIIVLYWLCGLGGILLSMNVRPNTHGVGASTAIFGLVGFYFSYIFSYWFYMGRVRCGQRIFLVIYVFLLVLLNSPLMQSDPHTDNIGHLGGFITGILVGFAITE